MDPAIKVLVLVAIASGRNRFDPRELPVSAVVLALVVYALLFAFHHRIFG